MFRKKRKALRTADLEALRASIIAEVREEMRQMLSLDRVDADGRPNMTALNLAVRNTHLANMNLKFFGFDLARQLAATLPVPAATQARHVGLGSKGSTQVDMETDWVAHWCGQLGVPVVLHRKMWELSYILQAIHEHGHMQPGARGLGFGCGQEPLPSYLASHGVNVTVTDLGAEEAQAAGWAATNQHAATLDMAFQSSMLSREAFDERVGLEIVDMNAIPPHLTGYDFCWSVCALEHLGSIEKGLAFVENSLATLRPGGVSVHTMEFNIDATGPTIDNWPTVLFQRHHLDELARRLRAKGHWVAELDYDLGDKPMDRFIDLPPWSHDMPPALAHWHGEGLHLKVGIDGFASTCFGVIVRKGG